MLNELIKKARMIEESTEATLSGAFCQVTKDLTIDECEKLFKETAGDDPKKIKKFKKKVARVRDNAKPEWFNLGGLRNDAMMILKNFARHS